MACETWREKLDAYVDGELNSSDAAALSAHLKSCPACSGEALERSQLKRSVALAGPRYQPSTQLRAKITKNFGTKQSKATSLYWKVLLIPALAVIIVSVAMQWHVNRESARREHVYSELADLHVAALASANPVDVVSTDRHTVKPWFEGKIPFSFNLPELQGSEFVLTGGRLAYVGQTPGAQLIYHLRRHEISVFIFPDRGETADLPSGVTHSVSFTEENWSENGLRYFVIGDVGPDDVQALSSLFKRAG